jgi:hypothetical protein
MLQKFIRFNDKDFETLKNCYEEDKVAEVGE